MIPVIHREIVQQYLAGKVGLCRDTNGAHALTLSPVDSRPPVEPQQPMRRVSDPKLVMYVQQAFRVRSLSWLTDGDEGMRMLSCFKFR